MRIRKPFLYFGDRYYAAILDVVSKVKNLNRFKERLWFSSVCIGVQALLIDIDKEVKSR